jgi:NAD(P)-dependent dehydrogenase (short-subunit alcohol dehydrogenase family)
MTTALIIGASRGLGLEFVRQYRAAGWEVVATVRDLDKSSATLTALGAQAYPLDVTKAEDFARLAGHMEPLPVDVCIYVSGVYGPRSEGVSAPSSHAFDEVMHANVLGAMRAIPALAPHLARRKGSFAFISSKMGSIGEMASSSGTLYRASKAALNAVVKSASLEWGPQGLTMFVIHPGWVKTDMGGANADIEPADSIAGMRKVIATAAGTGNGKFFNYDGSLIAW